ncbi:MAG TPA: prepilin-type N-terminal cleavage/methylation domain-containing protein [candidate division Zixibacteria bacterium]|nr:prepilin-type N-terminal cleavage/methylation domain-containing protein [candidate division Zixibacteria bacterium]
MMNRIRSNNGVTLIELLIAAVIALVCAGAALELYVNQQKNWLTQENITDMQQNGRAGIDEIVYHARQAGYHLPPALEAIYPSNSDPDSITFVYLKEPQCDCALTAPMPLPSSELKLSPDTIDCFEPDTWAYIYDPFADEGEFFLITWVQTDAGHLQHNTMSLSKKYPAGSIVYVIEVVTFYVDNTTDSLHPKLMYQRFEDANIYADNIEDLQFTYTLAHGAVVDSFISADNVREVNVDLVARTDRIDPARGQGYLRDTLSTTVYLRNMDF